MTQAQKSGFLSRPVWCVRQSFTNAKNQSWRPCGDPRSPLADWPINIVPPLLFDIPELSHNYHVYAITVGCGLADARFFPGRVRDLHDVAGDGDDHDLVVLEQFFEQ